MGWLIALGAVLVVLVVVGYVFATYNRLVRARNKFQTSFAQVDVQLTRRHDLIPNLVETAKGYIKHERETLEAVVNARAAAVSAQSGASGAVASDGPAIAAVGALAGAEDMLTAALSRMFVLAEAYPELKANQTMLNLQEELTTTENRIAFARQAYNDAVMEYNTRREVFPSNVVAGTFSFQPAALFEIKDPQERATPQVSF